MVETHLSNGRLPYMCATLFTKNAILSVVQKRHTKTVQNAFHKDSFQKYVGTKTGNAITSEANSGM